MFTSIAGKSLVVTGGSKRIGKGIAKVFAAKGAKVLLTGRHAETGNAVVDEITDAGGISAFFKGDVSSWEDMQEMASRARELHGGIDILCANAGISGEDAGIAKMTPAVWNKVINVNVTGSFLAVRACLPSMVEQGSGRII